MPESTDAAEARSISTADDLAQALRLRIQRSELAPGEWLREAPLCSEFGVGRSIVRRALRTLADDGLLEIEENRGARVSATTVEEVFDLYEIRAALYGLAARFACLRASDTAIRHMLVNIDRLLSDAAAGTPGEQIIEISEAIFSEMAESASADAQKMIDMVRRKTRFHFSYVALAINANGPGPYEYWRQVRAALIARDADKASQAARDILYFMQGEVARIMLARGPRVREVTPLTAPAPPIKKKRAAANRR
ncbi:MULTISPECIES: GntR family transcriptional regulator [unclassified Sphingomonas]|uniref:GntR family transcriptional regulator n=1 Tax=unclassified Sphingomonas TaxID=196159 RepID=UPI0022B36242|nr:GntR family transcriptional regulator [Sphingomonas sp. NIBR02145]WHU04514.1 GntR family transcriptional regulator [Sphingomonas sp. NIBR02145]